MTVPQTVAAAWGWADCELSPLAGGLINQTFRVARAGTPIAVLQQMHPVFRGEVNLDIDAVGRHLKAFGHDVRIPDVLPTRAGALWLDHEARPWRALSWLPGDTLHAVPHPSVARSAGALVGRFHRALDGFEHAYAFRRAGVHDTPLHLANLRAQMAAHAGATFENAAAIHALAQEILAAAALLPPIEDLAPRHCHGDLKISNLLFSEPGSVAAGEANGLKATALVDLDTIGKMPLAHELGDALRSWCNPAGEDQDEVIFRTDIFAAAMEGYQAETGPLADAAKRSIPAGLLTICTELAARFCADALADSYCWLGPGAVRLASGPQFAARKTPAGARHGGETRVFSLARCDGVTHTRRMICLGFAQRALRVLVVGAALSVLTTAAVAAPAGPPHGGAGRDKASAMTARLLQSRLTLLAADATGGTPLRDEVELAGTRVGQTPVAHAAWQALQGAMPGRWSAIWDKATGVPSRLWGPGRLIAGSSHDGAIAAAAAREFLRDHLQVLAPGATIGDFVLVANQLDGGIRTIGFAQYAHGVPVLGGQVGMRFLADRLYMVSSEALPGVASAIEGAIAAQARRGQPPRDLRSKAGAALTAVLAHAATLRSVEPLAILPLISRAGVQAYRLVQPTTFESATLGPFVVYSDAATGEPLAAQRRSIAAQATLVYDAVTRYPGSPRYNAPIARGRINVNGSNLTTSAAGVFSWSGLASAVVTTSLTSDDVKIENVAGDVASVQLTANDGGTVRWSAADNEQVDAQIQAFVHAFEVKQYARLIFPGAGFIEQQLIATVNIDSSCNAFSDGTNINFYLASDTCENTARLADVVYHEYGHVMHRQALIAGVGSFDGALSEGISDVVAADITGDSGMGRGFFLSDAPLRELNPDTERTWPEDIGEVHYTGTIFGGAMWDLRGALHEKYGETQGGIMFRALLAAAIQRSSNIPTSFMEVLAADDDNGDLADGTPNECEIREAFGRHGLRFVSANFAAPGAIVATTEENSLPLAFNIEGLSELCASDQISQVELRWKPLTAGGPEAGEVMAALIDNQWHAALPMPDDGNALSYQFRVAFGNGTTTTLPDNPASPYYQMYQGELVKLYCTDFETNPLLAGWHLAETNIASTWQWGEPTGGERASGDPTAAHSGQYVLGTSLAGSGLYPASADMTITSPPIEVAPYSDVRIQYRRWLNVEDSYYDKARISVNGVQLWENANSNNGDNSAVHHQDREWLFHDLRISGFIADPVLEVAFSLKTDEGLHLGGWNIDDFCVVADAWSTCGDGTINGAEQCDQGDANADVADACRTNCRRAVCGDDIVDGTEQCDDGARIAGDGCSNNCEIEYNKTSGCSAGGDAAPLAMIVMVVGYAARRRRPAVGAYPTAT
ncbi:MAG: phosphotransferase [Myxococcales bacterium]|nr:phosphotransferase [Myxococcales bacterium]